MGIGSIPTALLGGNHPHFGAQAAVLTVEVALLWCVGLTVLAREWRAQRHTDATVADPVFVRVYPAVYLGVMAVLWMSALSAFIDASDGVTMDGTLVGNGLYTSACFIASGLALVGAVSLTLRRQPPVVPVLDLGAVQGSRP
jgi:hypothetical protein